MEEMPKDFCNVSVRVFGMDKDNLEAKENFMSIWESLSNRKFTQKQKDIVWEYTRNAMPQEVFVLGTREAGEFLGRSMETIRSWIKKGKVRGWRNIEGLWWVPIEDLVAVL